MPKDIRKIKWQRTHQSDQIIFPILQHGLYQLRICLGGEYERRGEKISFGFETRH